MKIVIDKDIPFISGVLEPYFEVVSIKGKDIVHSDVLDAEAIIIRTRTKCTEALLQGTAVRYIGTATIGYDHIDMDYCERQGIKVVTAAGCNAVAVAQYVLAAVEQLQKKHAIQTIGVVGVGNVGKVVAEHLKAKGFKVLLNDPPRKSREAGFEQTELMDLLKESDLVTLHIPLWNTNIGFAGSSFFSAMGTGKCFINASRGEVVCEESLLEAVASGVVSCPVIDVWCDEPSINPVLHEAAFIATPHIAGYSLQGKANGSAMMIRALGERYGIKELTNWYPVGVKPNINSHIDSECYDILADSEALKKNINLFEELRNNYKYRSEFL